MNARPAFLARFTCLGAECEDTCCKGWDMQLDPSTLERYLTQAPELMDAVSGEAGHHKMTRDPACDYCVKFEGGLCGIQKKYGEGFLGDACYFYPRVTRTLGEETVMTATLSCPEIARLALFDADAFTTEPAPEAQRLPHSIHDYLQPGLTAPQAMAIHGHFISAALDESVPPQQALMRMVVVAQSLSRISLGSWPDAVPFYLEHADASVPGSEAVATDPFFLLQALCGLVAAAKKLHQPRLMQTIEDMQRALHITIPWETLTITPMPDSQHAAQELQQRWGREWKMALTPVLRRYVAAQISLALFPFAGFGTTLPERIAIIGIRFATVRLALMSACALLPTPLPQSEVVRIIQSLSRFLDHLAEPEFSLRIYRETGWLKPPRLRALMGE